MVIAFALCVVLSAVPPRDRVYYHRRRVLQSHLVFESKNDVFFVAALSLSL